MVVSRLGTVARPRSILLWEPPGRAGICYSRLKRVDSGPETKDVEMEWTHGPSFERDGIRFRLWAPSEARVDLVIEGRDAPFAMTAGANGFFETFVEGLGAGARYRFALAGGREVPDPASRFQPDDVNGPSEAIDPGAYHWRESWEGREWDDIVLYELHLGAFSPEGTFAGAASKLAHLARLGVMAIEIMPVSDFSGRWNWGYDGAFPYAPDASYGRPEDFKSFVEAAHGNGIAVLLDVVYSHFGPEGNFLPLYAADFFTSRHKTPWGDAIRFDGANSRPVRDFFIENAEYWIEEFHLDGLRFDAVHAIKDDTRPDLLDELAARLRARSRGPSTCCSRTRATIRAAWRAEAARPSSTPRNGMTTFITFSMSRPRMKAAAITPPMAGRSFWGEPSPKASPIRAR